MRSVVLVGLILLAFVPLAAGTHGQGCVPTEAEYYTPVTANGEVYYLIEVDPLVPINPPIPGSGFLSGGTFLYRETNGLTGPQQRGDDCKPFFPTPELLLYYLTHPCDPNFDEDCGHGADEIVL